MVVANWWACLVGGAYITIDVTTCCSTHAGITVGKCPEDLQCGELSVVSQPIVFGLQQFSKHSKRYCTHTSIFISDCVHQLQQSGLGGMRGEC